MCALSSMRKPYPGQPNRIVAAVDRG
jgi:hypothetical protein